MKNLSLLNVWNNLELAKNGAHPYGGNILEVYARYFVPSSGADKWRVAGQRLYVILEKFCELHDVGIFVDGKELGPWLNNYNFFHKCDIRVSKNESIKVARFGGGEEVQKDSAGVALFNEFGSKDKENLHSPPENVLQSIDSGNAKKLIGRLEACKATMKQKRSTEKRLPDLLKRLWKTMSSRRSKKMAL